MKQRDNEYKYSFLVGQIDCKITKEKTQLLIKCFVNSFRNNPSIFVRNVRKLPKLSLFEPRKKSKKRIAISKLALQYFKLTAKIGRRRLNYSQNDLLAHSEKILQYVLGMCQNCLKCNFLNQEKSHSKGWRPQNLPSSRSNWKGAPFLNSDKNPLKLRIRK